MRVQQGFLCDELGTKTLLSGAETWTSSWYDVSLYGEIVFAARADVAGTLYAQFSAFGTEAAADSVPSQLTFDVAAATNEVHRLARTRRFFRLRYVNGASAQASFHIQTFLGSTGPLTSPLNTTITSDADSFITRSVLYGQTRSGGYIATPSTNEGHTEVAIHDPLLPFGSVHTEILRPIFQSDAVYGVNPQQVSSLTSLSGTVTASDSAFVLSTGTTVGAQAILGSVKRLRYRAGQGVVGRFTALFTTPVASSYQIVGYGHAEDGIYVGYKDLVFGLLYVVRGVREVRTFTITTASSTAENVVITLNSVPFNVAVTNSGNIQRTVWEISQGTYSGWSVDVVGATVRFVSASAGAKTGTYSVAGTTIVGTTAQTKAGADSTDTFIPQSSFNGDTLDGTGRSGFTIDPTKYNIFQTGIQYLGAGTIDFRIRAAPSGNNPEWILFHTIRNPNTLTATNFGNPSFPFTAAAYSAGSTTNLTVKTASFAGFIEGGRYLHGPRFSYFRQLTTVGDTNYQALFTVMNSKYYASRTNQAVINIISVSGALKHNSPCIFYLIRNGALVGNPNFSSYATNSCSLFDNTAATVTVSGNNQIIWSGHLGDTGEIDHHFNPNEFEELTLQPGEWLTLAAKSSTGTPTYVTGSINTREDQ